ncbi:MAG TPA: hypothetical protein VGV87_05045 [Blastocatellia bacterium]|nr:hypothetical protein [Blastocatellia bacterium]
MATDLTHQELSLLVFALEGPDLHDDAGSSASCEEACPVVEHFEEIFGGEAIPPEKQLVRHLNNHLREALIECGMLEVIGNVEHNHSQPLSPEAQVNLQRMNARLNDWSCEVSLDPAERRILYEALSRLPRSAWLSMPRTMWRLRKKLKAS